MRTRTLEYEAEGSSFLIACRLDETGFSINANESGRPVSLKRLLQTAPLEFGPAIETLAKVNGCRADGMPSKLAGKKGSGNVDEKIANFEAFRKALTDGVAHGDSHAIERLTSGACDLSFAKATCLKARETSAAIFSSFERRQRIADLAWAVCEAASRSIESIDSPSAISSLLGLRNVRMALARLSARSGSDFQFFGFPSLTPEGQSAGRTRSELVALKKHASVFFAGIMGRQPYPEIHSLVNGRIASHLVETTIVPQCRREWRERAKAALSVLNETSMTPIVVPVENGEAIAFSMSSMEDFIADRIGVLGGDERRDAFVALSNEETVPDAMLADVMRSLEEIGRADNSVGIRAREIYVRFREFPRDNGHFPE